MDINKQQILARRHQLSPSKQALLAKRLRGEIQSDFPINLIPKRDRTDPAPLSFAQQRLWLLQQIDRTNSSYNEHGAIQLKGSLNIPALERSLNEIVQRHESLRTTFKMMEGQPVQIISPSLTLKLPTVNLSDLPLSEQKNQIQRIAIEQSQSPFDLAQGPLLRWMLLQIGEQDYVLLVTMHHIIYDGWSYGVLMRELAALYEAFSNSKSSPLSELPIQYADFALWQQQSLKGEGLETQIAYWKQKLGNTPPVLQLPADYPRPAVQTFRGARISFSLTSDLTKALKALSQKEDVTFFMTLLAAFKILLYRYTGIKDIVIGSPIANRNRAEIEGLIGCFVNTLVLRTDLSGNPTFQELLGRVRQVALGAYAHSDLPFEKLVEVLQPQRSLSYTPLFQVMFALQNTPMPALELSGLTVSSLESNKGTAKFDLSLDFQEKSEETIGTIEYNTDIFEAATIARMSEHFQQLLAGIVANPDRHLDELPLLTEAERHQLLIEWNNTQVDYSQNMCIHQLFEAQVERTPDAIAVVFENQQLTYRELNARANQLAHHLQAIGVKPEVLVGICMERSLEMAIGLLGILKAGGAYVPLEPSYPQERLAFMLEDTGVSVLLTQTQPIETLLPHQAKVICLDAAWEPNANSFAGHYTPQRDRNPSSQVTIDNLAYVIYTSGSTGRPKGVMNTHTGLCNRLLWMQDAYQLIETDRVLQKTPFSFDVSVWEFFWPLIVGARLVIAQPGGHQDSAYLVKLIDTQQITTLHFVPSMLQIFLEEQGLESCNSLRSVFCSGEALSFELQQRFFVRLDAELHNLYGPTEAAIDVTFWHCQRQSDLPIVPIGRPIANTQIYLLDCRGEPVPIGIPGELHIGGNGLARGYLNSPELTAEKFISNPFSKSHEFLGSSSELEEKSLIQNSKLYKTGDLARYLPNGEIDYLGRIDHQVKIRGFRIELGEIEAVLLQHPAIREAVVLAREDVSSQKRLVAYVVGNERCGKNEPESLKESIAHHPLSSELRNFLKEKLPDYMLPSAFVFLDVLPLTPNGKVDRRSLPAPDTTRPELESNFVSPRTPVEEILAGIWSNVLRREPIGVHDNFFELGGDSILSLQIIFKANQVGFKLTPKQLFQHQTIAELATVVDTNQLIAIEAEQGVVTGAIPLTPIQYWFFEQELPELHHWNQAVLLEVRQALNPLVLEKAIQHLLLHHDALRLRFDRQALSWQQVNADDEETVPLTTMDLSALSDAKQKAVIEATATELQKSLNLSKGPLVRVALFDFGADRLGRLLIAIHHLAVDGVSWRILLEDLQTAYQQINRGEAVHLPPKTTSFKYWAERLNSYAKSGILQRDLDYWCYESRRQISALPVDYVDGNNTQASACTVSVLLGPEETQALLEDVPGVYNTQINDVLLAALVEAFARWTEHGEQGSAMLSRTVKENGKGRRSLLIDLEGHGREELFEDVDLSRTVGWFTTIFPILLDLGEISDPGERLKSVKEQLRDIPNRGIGYGLLRYLSDRAEIAAKLRELPQAEVIFNYLGQVDGGLSESSLFLLAKESSGLVRSPLGSRRYLLEVDGLVVNSQLKLDWTYSKNVYKRSSVVSLAEHFLEALRSLILHCQSPDAGGFTPSDFPLAQLSQQELDEVFEMVEFEGGYAP